MIGGYLRRKAKHLLSYAHDTAQTEKVLVNQGRILSHLNRERACDTLAGYEWQVFSQWGEDGIIDFLVSEVPIVHETFIEFGVESFHESNCRFLMMHRNWQGFVIDGSEENMRRLRRSHYFWKHDLQCRAAFVTAENIDALCRESSFDADLGILSVDIDGNDYHVLKAIVSYAPRIVICEFNPVFGTEREITVPYDPGFQRTTKHPSNLYFGASIGALTALMRDRGYTLVGTGRFGANAYFVQDALLTDRLRRLAAAPVSVAFNWRESRDADGRLTFLRGEARHAAIRGMEVLNIRTNEIERL